MVDLDPLDADDVELLQKMIANDYEYTKSGVAKFVLDDLENQLRNFVKVYPRDYKMVMKVKSEKLKVKG